MTAQQIVYNIKNLKAGGKQSDDTQLSDSQYLFIIDYYRSILIRQQHAKKQSIDEFIVQDIKITLAKDAVDKCLWNSSLAIPKPIEVHNTNLITFVGNNLGLSYQRTDFNKDRLDSYAEFTSSFPKYFIQKNKLKVRNHKGKEELIVRGVFESPLDVVKFNGEYNAMNPLDFEYPISSTMLDTTLKMIVDSEVKLSLLVPQDNLNNGKEDIN